MKKIVSLLVVLLLIASTGLAEMVIQIIEQENAAQTPFRGSIKLEEPTTIEDYAELLATAYGSQDVLGYYFEGMKILDNSSPGINGDYYYSGADAEYCILRMDITNLELGEKDFLEKAEVKAVFDNKYEYRGWAYQLNYNNGVEGTWGWEKLGYGGRQNTEFVIDQNDQFPIGPMYTGHYFFGCTLPNAIIESNKPLRLEIKLDEHEITYIVRK